MKGSVQSYQIILGSRFIPHFNLNVQGQIFFGITLVRLNSNKYRQHFWDLQKHTLINWKILCHPKSRNTHSLCLGLTVSTISASFTYGGGKAKPEITTERQSSTRGGWVADTFDLLAHMPQQETWRLSEESLTHSGSLNPKKAQQLLTEHVSFQNTWFPQKINKLPWLNVQGFCWFGWLFRFFYPKLLFLRVRYVKLNTGSQNSIILIAMLRE